MFSFNLTSEIMENADNMQYGTRDFTLSPGWYTCCVDSIAEPYTSAGVTKSYITFKDVATGTTFREWTTWAVEDSKDVWRVKQTQALVARICKVTGTPAESWQTIVGKNFSVLVDLKESKKVETNPETLEQTTRVFKNNGIKAGPLADVIKPVPEPDQPQANPQADNGFSFSF